MASQETKRLLDSIRALISHYKGDLRELYEDLLAEADGWKMALDEMESEAN